MISGMKKIQFFGVRMLGIMIHKTLYFFDQFSRFFAKTCFSLKPEK
jgi:hypothetical protein